MEAAVAGTRERERDAIGAALPNSGSDLGPPAMFY